ncbi:hypothetical protein ACWEGE_28150 [Amycolatopsis sp. NPDC004747]
MSKATGAIFLLIGGMLLITLLVLALVWRNVPTIVLAGVVAVLFAYAALSLKRNWRKLG